MNQDLKRYTTSDFDEFPKEFRRNFMNCLSGFKSLCLCGTMNKEGLPNLSLISSVIHVGANPPLMGMLMRPETVQRDTIENIRKSGVFTLNHVNPKILEAAHQASARYPTGVSEFEETNLTPLLYDKFSAPFVQESVLRIGLHFQERHTILANATTLYVGKVVMIEVDEEVIRKDGFIDLEGLGSLTASGLDSYHSTNQIKRLSYARPGQISSEL